MTMHSRAQDRYISAYRKFNLAIALYLIFAILVPNTVSAENFYVVTQQKKYNIGCTPTPPDALGPFYKPNAPLRHSVGKGYRLSGRVISTKDCSPIPRARIELWMAGPDGDYKDNYRATVFSNEAGGYYFGSHLSPSYRQRPPHIHMRVTADGFKKLITQHYPGAGSINEELDLILIPE